MQRGAPEPPPGTEHALERFMSHAMPQPLQLLNDASLRPSAPGATIRPTQLVPQQRSFELQLGRQSPVGIEESVPGITPPSGGGPPTHAASRHVRDGQAMPQPPQLSGSFTMLRQEMPPVPSQHM